MTNEAVAESARVRRIPRAKDREVEYLDSAWDDRSDREGRIAAA